MRQKRKELNLKQKVFIVKSFYQCNDVVVVRELVKKNFSLKIKNSVEPTILKLVEAFENTGSVNNHFSYDVGEDELIEDEVQEEITIEIQLPAQEELSAGEEDGEPQLFEVYEVVPDLQQADTIEEEQDDPSYVPEDESMKEDQSPGKKTTSPNDSRNKRVTCRYCDKVFCGRYLYNHYRKVHSNEPIYVCKLCQATFQSFPEYKDHRSEHALKNLDCQYCKKKLPNTSTYNRHMKSHQGIKDHICEVCGKAFQEAHTLKLHLRCHTGEKPHKCSYRMCGKAFATQASLRVHERIHTGERPYKCQYCDKAFADSSTRNVRMEISYSGSRLMAYSFLSGPSQTTHRRVTVCLQNLRKDVQTRAKPQVTYATHARWGGWEEISINCPGNTKSSRKNYK